MPSTSSPKSVVAPATPSRNTYRWLFLGLLLVLAIIVIVALMRAKREPFESGAGTLLYFYMPECGHCKKFNPEWEKLQSMVDEQRAPLKLNKIDGTEGSNKDLVSQHGVEGFPTIILEVGNQAHKYDGDRTASAVLEWAKAKLAL